MKLPSILSGTYKGFVVRTENAPTPSVPAGIHRLLAATQRGLGMRVATPVAAAKKMETIPVGTPEPDEASSEAPTSPVVAAPDAVLSSVPVAFASGLYRTKAGVAGERLLADNRAALRTYLTVQLRSAEAASKALVAIQDMLENGTADELKQGPTKRAALYLAARNHVEYERLFSEDSSPQLSEIPWQLTPAGKVEQWGRALDEMRFGLGESETELLLLHQISSLKNLEIAYVLGLEEDEVERNLEAGTGFARLLLADIFDEVPDIEEVLTDALQVVDLTPEQLAASAKPAVVQLPVGTLLGDRYEIEGTLGGGEFAYVYRARDVRVPGHVVALKLLHRVALTDAAREGAMRELSLIASAFHPSLVQFKDHGWFDDRLWFVMPFYEGEMLLDRIQRGPMELEEALEQFERLARGLAALHAAGIRHQDVKPENIYLVEMQNEVLPILLDLGVAAPNGEMALAGTPMYFPPEVAARIFDEECELPLTPKTDVFALGLSLLHSIEEPDLSGLVNVEIDDFIRARACEVHPGPRTKSLAFLRPSFARWLARDPRDRPSAMELANEIAEIRLGRGRRVFVAPKGLRGVLFALAMGTLLLTSLLLVDSPTRTIEVVGGEAAAPVVQQVAPVMSETDSVRLIRSRLETEERRALELEEELTRVRRRALGINDGSPP